MLKDRECKYCNKIFIQIDGRIFSNHVKWCENNPNNPKLNLIKCKYCNKEINKMQIDLHEKTCYLNPTNIKYCKNCNKLINKPGIEIFCSHSCSAFYNNKYNNSGYKFGTIYTKTKTNCDNCKKEIYVGNNTGHKYFYCDECSKLRLYKNLEKNKEKRICKICKKEFYHYKSAKKTTCSEECCKKLISKYSKNNPNCGGETNYKRYIYKGISMDSSWEVKIAELLDDLNVEWNRSKKLMYWWTDKNGEKRRYYPDFYLPHYNIFLDTKNKFLIIKDKYKINQVQKENNIQIICGLLKYVENWILKQSFPN